MSNSPTLVCRRASSPRVYVGHRASRPMSCSFSPMGRAERWAKGRARGARMFGMRAPRMTSFWQRHTGDPRAVREKRHTGVRFTPRAAMSRTATEANSRLRSAREWIYRLAGCPRVWRFCPRPPFVRAVARTGTRAVRLGHRCLCPARRLGRLEPDVSADLRIPPSRPEDNRSVPLKWSGMTTKYS